MRLDRVSVTGADNSVSPEDLIHISERFPFVEWAILFSPKKIGDHRFPTRRWVEDLISKTKDKPLRLAAHLCGKYCRDLALDANPTWASDFSNVAKYFQRVQLNFHGHYHRLHYEFLSVLDPNTQYILQHDGANTDSILELVKRKNIVALYDTSGGAGKVPKVWIPPIAEYMGYAGGLSPTNVDEKLKEIQNVYTLNASPSHYRIWIDAESRLRSEDDSSLDLNSVVQYLRIAKPFVHV